MILGDLFLMTTLFVEFGLQLIYGSWALQDLHVKVCFHVINIGHFGLNFLLE